MDVSAVCRTCLKSEYLNPIFPTSDDWTRYSSAVHITTGVKIELNDGLPQNMCSICIHFVNQSLKFRRTCKDIQDKLLDYLDNGVDNSSLESPDESCKDFTVFSGDKINTQIKIEIDEKELNGNKSVPVKSEYTNHEVLSDDDDVDGDGVDGDGVDDKEPLNHLAKETDSFQNDVKVETNKSKTKTTLSESDLYLPSDSKTTSKHIKRVICKLCQKELSIRSIDGHMNRAHPGADLRKIKCDLCDNYFIKEKMNWHMSRIHGVKKGQKKDIGRCGYCKAEFDSKEELKQHAAGCTDKKRKRKVYEWGRQLAECDICHKKMQKASIRTHKAKAHAGMRPVCEHCGRACANIYRLNEHYRAKHGYDKLKCSLCEFKTASILSMRNHDRRHRGEKPFVCETCGAKFHAGYLLAQHKQSHRTDRPLKCDLCTASFKVKSHLHTHRKACHGPPLYRCAACPRTYSCRKYAVRHMRAAHRFSGPLPPLRGLDDAPDDDDEVSK